MVSKGWTWGVLLLAAVTSAGACDDDDDDGLDGGGASGADAGGEGTQAGMPSVDAGGPPGGTGGSSTSGANGGGQGGGDAGGQGGGDAGGESGRGGEAGHSLGGSNGEGSPPTLSCPDDGAGGAYGQWYPLGGAGGAQAADEYHSVRLGSEQIAIAINDSGQMLITAGWGSDLIGESDSCQAWVVDADSVSEVTTSESGCVLAVDMNDAGTVLASQGSVPFLWKDGIATPLSGVASGTPIALNDAEQVVLRSTPVGPALWQAGTLTPLRTSTDQHLIPVAINEDGEVIGYSGIAEQTWLWEAGSASALGLQAVHALNDVGDIAGVKDGAAGVLSEGIFTPFRTDSGDLTPTDLNDMRVLAMTDSGVLVGDVYEIGEPDLARPFRIEAGVAYFLATYGSARDINAHDEIVGRRSSIRGCMGRECWIIEGYWPTLWVTDCPSACCAP